MVCQSPALRFLPPYALSLLLVTLCSMPYALCFLNNGQLTTDNGQCRRLGFIRARFGVSNEFLMLLIGLLHVTRHAEEGLQEGRGKVLEF